MNIQSLTFKKYPGQQQVDMQVVVDMPGIWFTSGPLGGLTAAERRVKYAAMAVEFDEAHVFEPEDKKKRKPARLAEALRFICPDDAADDADHKGYWIELDSWNRYRNDTYKNNREAEVRSPPLPCASHFCLSLFTPPMRTPPMRSCVVSCGFVSFVLVALVGTIHPC